MKAALLIESLTGNTQKAGDRIANDLQQVGWSVTGVSRVKLPDFGSIQDADMIIVGTWVHGLFVVGQAPWGLGAISTSRRCRARRPRCSAPSRLSPGKTLDKLTSAVSRLGAEVIGGLALNRGKIEAHSEEFVTRLVDSVPVRV